MCIAKSSVGFLLVLDVVEALSSGQVLLIVLNGLFEVSQGVVTVGDIAVGPAPVQHAFGPAQLLQHGQLLLKVSDGLLEHGHVHFGDAHVPVDLSLQSGVPESQSQTQLGLVALEGCAVVPNSHVHRRQVAEGAALPLLVTQILAHGQLPAVEGQGCVQLAEEPAGSEGVRVSKQSKQEVERELAPLQIFVLSAPVG